MTTSNKWWGDITFSLNEIKVWSIGERKVAIQRLKKEWVIWNQESENENHANIDLGSLENVSSLEDVMFSRHLLNQTEDVLSISPALADRSIVARPASKLHILPGEQIELYVSSPLWFTVKLPTKSFCFADIPFWRPSDSWFGPSPMVGELCYAKFTDAKVNLSQLEKREYRAITNVLIKNRHDQTLSIERINLPVPFFNLYVDKERQFWTDQIEITHRSDTEQAGITINEHSPGQLNGHAEHVADARHTSHQSHFVKSIKSLLE